MPLTKCPDCDKMISDRVLACPHCGCPSNFFEKRKDEQLVVNKVQTKQENIDSDIDAIVFRLTEKLFIKYEKGSESFAKFFGTYETAARDFCRNMQKAYEDAGNIVNAIQTLPEQAIMCINSMVDLGTKLLYENGVIITPDSFYDKYHKKYNFDYESYLKDVIVAYNQILEVQEELATQRAYEKASRSRWQGGGFGLKGAIKGAITASALNAGSDLLHSFGDAAKTNKDKEKIKQKLNELYKRESTENAFCYSVYIISKNIAAAMQEELCAINYFPKVINFDYREANRIYDAAIQYETNQEKLLSMMVQCIQLYPADDRFYELLYPILLNGDNDFAKFLDFWHLNCMFDTFAFEQEQNKLLTESIEQAGISDFDFQDFTPENALKLRQFLYEFEEEYDVIGNEGTLTENIQKYCKAIEYKDCIADMRLSDWMPQDIDLEKCLRDMAYEYYFPKTLMCCDEYCGETVMSVYKGYGEIRVPKSIYTTICSNKELVLIYYDSSMLKNDRKGFAVTTNAVWDLKTLACINIREITDIRPVAIKDKYGIAISDGMNKIIIQDSVFGHDEYAELTEAFANQLKVLFVRYLGNVNLWCEEMLTPKPSVQNQSDIAAELRKAKSERESQNLANELAELKKPSSPEEAAEIERDNELLLEYNKETHLLQFDFTDFSNENVMVLRNLLFGFINKYDHWINKKIDFAEIVDMYFHTYSKVFWNEEKEEYQYDIAFFDWIPDNISIESFLAHATTDTLFFYDSILEKCWSVADKSLSYQKKQVEQPSRGIKIQFEQPDEKILLYFEEGGLSTTGFVMTNSQIIQLKDRKNICIALKDISNIEVTGKNFKTIRISDGMQKMTLGEYWTDIAFGDQMLYFSALIKTLASRYCGNNRFDTRKTPMVEIPKFFECSNCGKELKVGTKFCNYCGTCFEETQTCKHCGKQIKKGIKFCSYCGEKTNEEDK